MSPVRLRILSLYSGTGYPTGCLFLRVSLFIVLLVFFVGSRNQQIGQG